MITYLYWYFWLLIGYGISVHMVFVDVVKNQFNITYIFFFLDFLLHVEETKHLPSHFHRNSKLFGSAESAPVLSGYRFFRLSNGASCFALCFESTKISVANSMLFEFHDLAPHVKFFFLSKAVLSPWSF